MDAQATTIRNDLSDLVRDSALLADLTVSQWSGERTDSSLMAQLKADHHAVGNTGRVVKNLLAGCDKSLKQLRAAYTVARQLHHTLTLPWVASASEAKTGPRLLPNVHFMDYVTRMGGLRKEAERQLDAFIAEYPDLVTQAMQNLAGMAKHEDYPGPEAVRAMFRLSFDFTPIPSGTAFHNLPDNVLDSLGRHLHERQERAAQASQTAMWERVRGVIEHLHDRLKDEDTIFKTATIDSVNELVGVLPGFNVCADPRVDEIVQGIKDMMVGVDAKDLRTDHNLRRSVVSNAKQLTDKLSNWGV